MVHAPFAIAKRLGCAASPQWGSCLMKRCFDSELKNNANPGTLVEWRFPDEGFMHYVMIQSLYAFRIPVVLI